MIIRDATVDDLDTLIDLGSKMHEESLEPYPPIERDHALQYVEMAVAHPGVFLLALAEKDNPVGMITAVAGAYCFSSRLRTASDLLFVLPEHRGGKAAMKLVARYNEWADSLGVWSSTLSVATGISPSRTGRFFEHMGFDPMERTYRRGFN